MEGVNAFLSDPFIEGIEGETKPPYNQITNAGNIESGYTWSGGHMTKLKLLIEKPQNGLKYKFQLIIVSDMPYYDRQKKLIEEANAYFVIEINNYKIAYFYKEQIDEPITE